MAPMEFVGIRDFGPTRISVNSRTLLIREKRQAEKSDYILLAANRTSNATYGTITLSLDFELRRVFTWRFVVADMSKPIIGVDLLCHYNPLVDVHNQYLLDGLTQHRMW